MLKNMAKDQRYLLRQKDIQYMKLNILEVVIGQLVL